ncbi:transcriptional activator RfaH [Vibrio sp. 10N.286.49.B3]|uniref:transcription/translation regulatory transformer protein RfaH n=1 Tax=Vibrio sp. 10N.286.49.B3 TaxID=1880855 RepID=UPI000C829E94|nr:transcription/translation regulatory transformer protein RfaH [Vibrio sp. 10N.286.49.B3]PMH46857.1 transcriptional activator RfaH [Vibrio sp. 10N.286.49.B3]
MKRWYLLYCKRGDQPRAKMHLENQGIECYYPQIQIEKIVRKKKKMVAEPLFPSYMFIHFDFEQGPSFTTIRSTRGVSDFIRMGPHPKVLEGSLIYELKCLEEEMATDQQALAAESSAEVSLKKGDKVQLSSGQFAGIDAIYQESSGENRSIMLIQMINRPVAVTVDNSHFQ